MPGTEADREFCLFTFGGETSYRFTVPSFSVPTLAISVKPFLSNSWKIAKQYPTRRAHGNMKGAKTKNWLHWDWILVEFKGICNCTSLSLKDQTTTITWYWVWTMEWIGNFKFKGNLPIFTETLKLTVLGCYLPETTFSYPLSGVCFIESLFQCYGGVFPHALLSMKYLFHCHCRRYIFMYVSSKPNPYYQVVVIWKAFTHYLK